MGHVAEVETAAPENLSARIYSDLRTMLITGQLKPAETLSIRKLADKYDVSGMPVREALRQLASEGALIGAAKKAYRVPDLTPKQAADLFFVRSVLEGAAAEIAASRTSKANFGLLERLIADMNDTWARQDAAGFLRANFLFHGQIYALTENTALQASIETLYVRTGPWLAHGIVHLVDRSHWLGEHEDILDALRRGDGAETRRLMEIDAQWGSELYRGIGQD